MHFCVENVQHVFPVLAGIGMEEVRINGSSYSHFPKKWFLGIGILDIGISPQSLLIEVSAILDTRIDDRYPPVVLQQICHLIEWKFGLIYSEDLAIYHIIKIAPDSVKWDLVLFKIVNDFLQLEEGWVAPSALMVAKWPERRQICPATVDVELIYGRLGVGVAKEEAEIYDAAYSFEDEIVEMFGSVACGLNCIHCVGGAIVVNMEKSRFFFH